MAESLDLKQGSYSDIERGKAGVTGILTKLIMKYRVNPIWLLEGIGIRRMNEATLMLLCTEISDLERLLQQKDISSTIKLYEIIDRIERNSEGALNVSMFDKLKKEISALMLENSKLQKDIEKKDKSIKEFMEKHENLKALFDKFSKGL